MALLIDGYNLLHATSIVGRGPGPTELHRSREALLDFLSRAIATDELSATEIVFDASQAPHGQPQTVAHNGLTVHYARGYADADAMLAELIERHHTPRKLTVVSSDHQVQRAARRRRAKAVDSEKWFATLLRNRHDRASQTLPQPGKPVGALDSDHIEYWVSEFTAASSARPDEVTRRMLPPAEQHAGEPAPADESTNVDDAKHENPFPPGYAEDLLDGHET